MSNSSTKKTVHVALVGNPNCGKTTLFNALTGSHLKVANWPGVTVEKKTGAAIYEDIHISLVDTPGIYSLTSYTIEEQITRTCIMDEDIEAVINIVDASSLERNLYLTMQLLELGKPVILALNMMDIVEERGLEIDLHRLPEMLGDIPVIPVSAIKRKGLDILLHAIVHHYEEESQEFVIDYGPLIENKIAKLSVIMKARYPAHALVRWHAVKLLEDDEAVRTDHPVQITDIADKSYEKEIIQARYAYIETIIAEVILYQNKVKESTDRADRFLTSPLWGVPIFLGIMGLIFFFTFTIGDHLKGYLELWLEHLSGAVYALLTAIHTAEWMTSLIVDGIIAGVGAILTFTPNLAILFLALAILEDSGYMARVAYVMDSIMGKAGLSGKAFLPMILGFGCTVPAVMAARSLEAEKDRRRTMILIPFMSCSAKLPIYVLFSGMFFDRFAGLAAFSMYLLGVACAVLIAKVLHILDKNQENESLLIELPEYKRPNFRTIRIFVGNKLTHYLTKAGTVIFAVSIIVWAILNVGPSGMVGSPADSFGAMIGRGLVPLLKPAGLGMWQIAIALISGISAKEVVVSSFMVLFGANGQLNGTENVVAQLRLIDPGFGALNAYAMMVFCLLYVPCAAAVGTIRKESGSTRFTVGLLVFQVVFAWLAAVLVYQVGSLFI